jgi:hypothetical protein
MRLSANLRFEFRGRLPGSNGSDDTVAGLQCGVRDSAAEATADACNKESLGDFHLSILETEGAAAPVAILCLACLFL